MDAKDYAVRLMRRCASHNPFTIVRELDILLIYCPLIDLNGFYQYHKRNHIIYLSEDLEEHEARFVLAHELGHMQMHRSLNTVFMDTKTFYPHSRSAIISSTCPRTWRSMRRVLFLPMNLGTCKCTVL